MQLLRLELKGFKSFADKTIVKFSPGMTAVIGPNGSGKSNITDAMKWVLGESNVRNLRGQKAEDIIFCFYLISYFRFMIQRRNLLIDTGEDKKSYYI